MRVPRGTFVRCVLAGIGFCSVVVGYPWLAGIVMLLLALRYRAWEILGIGVAMDLLWLPSGISALPLFTIGAIVLLWGLESFRNEILV